MLKLPQLFHTQFLKEGVVYALEQLAARTIKVSADLCFACASPFDAASVKPF
jgi:hypothetical protein